MRNRFEKELELLNNELIKMGCLIENAIEYATDALMKQDNQLAYQAIEFDKEVDEKRKEIERLCLKLLLQQQPVATDLRIISTALKMITDMERIGDQATDISEITIRLTADEYIKKLVHIPQMAKGAIKMVRDSIDAFVGHDLSKANEVIAYDDVIDGLFDTVKAELLGLIRENVNNGEQAVDLLMIAKYFEKIGDHAENIAEWVVFSITGVHKNERIL
ncbi:MAG: Phosphate transport system protein PhoU [Clostridia bacterium]|jgi:phosphate transport system protein|nr:Phosphate transport system protein PhoU [Clostridia bacterium]